MSPPPLWVLAPLAHLQGWTAGSLLWGLACLPPPAPPAHSLGAPTFPWLSSHLPSPQPIPKPSLSLHLKDLHLKVPLPRLTPPACLPSFLHRSLRAISLPPAQNIRSDPTSQVNVPVPFPIPTAAPAFHLLSGLSRASSAKCPVAHTGSAGGHPAPLSLASAGTLPLPTPPLGSQTVLQSSPRARIMSGLRCGGSVIIPGFQSRSQLSQRQGDGAGHVTEAGNQASPSSWLRLPPSPPLQASWRLSKSDPSLEDTTQCFPP